MFSPDPAFSANVYCGDLDALVRGAVVPFREQLRERDPGGRWSLWMMRYLRGGQHLKIRVHGPDEERAEVQAMLEAHVTAWLGTLPPAGENDPPRVSRPRSLPIDLEDEQAEDHPDRSLVWTRYRRSLVSLGPNALLRADDGYVARKTACFAAEGEIVLESAREGTLTPAGKLKVLLRALAVGLTAMGFAADERMAYLEYHRDWLLRFALPHRDKEVEMLGRFGERLAGMQDVVQQAVRELEAWEDGAPAGAPEPLRAWHAAIGEFFAYAVRFRGNLEEYPADPFTDDAVFLSVFKAQHALANQLGVDMLNEALIYHVLREGVLSAAAPAARAA